MDKETKAKNQELVPYTIAGPGNQDIGKIQ